MGSTVPLSTSVRAFLSQPSGVVCRRSPSTGPIYFVLISSSTQIYNLVTISPFFGAACEVLPSQSASGFYVVKIIYFYTSNLSSSPIELRHRCSFRWRVGLSFLCFPLRGIGGEIKMIRIREGSFDFHCSF